MKKFFKFALVAVTALAVLACKKTPKDPTPGPEPEPEPQPEEYAGPTQGTSAWSVIGSLLDTNWDTDFVCAENNGVFVLKNVKLAAANEFKFRENKAWDNAYKGVFVTLGEPFTVDNAPGGDNIKPGLDGIYDLYLNVASSQAAITAKDAAEPTWAEPAPAGREGKAFKLTPETSENAIFEKSEYVDLSAGATFQVKFYANSWKTGDCDRLCCFESKTESPSMLVRFSNDGTQPGQLRFNNNAWRVGGGDGVKLTDKDGNAYIYEKQKWHVLTMVLTPGEGNAVTVDFYDNENLINSATGEKTSATQNFFLQRFEFGMSWEDGTYNNESYPKWQLFDGYIDYARVWSRPLSATEIAEGLCDVDPTAEGLLTYWVMDDGKDNGIIVNRAADKDYNIDFSKMSEMNGGTLLETLDLKDSFMNALEETDTPLCEF